AFHVHRRLWTCHPLSVSCHFEFKFSFQKETQNCMDDSTKKPSSGKPGDGNKKPTPPNNNMVWYLLGLGVLLLLMVMFIKGGTQQDIPWSDLEKLIAATDPMNQQDGGSYIMVDRSGTQPRKWKLSHL